MLRLLSLSLALVLFSSPAHSSETPPDTLGFELPRAGWFAGWGGAPRETQFVDSTIVYSGRYAARLERGASSPNTFSAATRAVPVTFTGRTIELRGWLKTKDVTGGFAGLWLREDSKEKPTIQFDNMKDRGITGTTDWAEFSIKLPLDIAADMVYFGAVLAGQGTVWVDDIHLFVDGKPLAEAPARVRPETAIDKDHEFDAGSKITATSLSKAQIDNLVVLGKVWGFVKYHHPRIAAGEVSWDYELFRVLPDVLAANDTGAARAAMSAWVSMLCVFAL